MSGVGRWRALSQAGQQQRLAGELEGWRQGVLAGLERWSGSTGAHGELLREELQRLSWATPWALLEPQLERLHEQSSALADALLVGLGPTEHPALNQLCWLLEQGDEGYETAYALLSAVRRLEEWAAAQGWQGEAWLRLRGGLHALVRAWVGDEALPSPELLAALWAACEAAEAGRRLGGPTRSPRWNSVLAALADPTWSSRAEGLELLRDDVVELGEGGLLPEDLESELLDCLDQLDDPSTALEPLRELLLEADDLVRVAQSDAEIPGSRARQAAESFQAGELSLPQFQRVLQELGEQLSAARNSLSDDGAVQQLEAGLDILFSVERPGQSSRLEMGCHLIDEGLEQLRKLEETHGD